MIVYPARASRMAEPSSGDRIHKAPAAANLPATHTSRHALNCMPQTARLNGQSYMKTSQKSCAPLSYLKAAKDFEAKWQRHWRETKAFGTDPIRLDQPKQVILDFFPYPSGIGLHVGHPSITMRSAVCTTRSRTVGIPSGRFSWLPGLGM
jgi:hypothetical protein